MEMDDPLTQAFATRYRETCDVVAARPTCGHDIPRHTAFGTTRPRKRPAATLVAHRLGLWVRIARPRPLHVGRSVWLRRPRRGSLGCVRGCEWAAESEVVAHGGPRARARIRGPHTARMRAPRMRMRLKPSIETHAKRRVGCVMRAFPPSRAHAARAIGSVARKMPRSAAAASETGSAFWPPRARRGHAACAGDLRRRRARRLGGRETAGRAARN